MDSVLGSKEKTPSDVTFELSLTGSALSAWFGEILSLVWGLL